MEKNKNHILYDTQEDVTYKDYLTYCEDSDITPEGEESGAFLRFCDDTRDLNRESFSDNCTNSADGNCPVLIVGTLGLWDGKPTIYPVRYESLLEAVRKCSNKCEDVKVTLNNGVIYVEAYHHDGTNLFEIHKLSQRGTVVTDGWCGKQCPHLEHKNYWLAKFKLW